MSTIRQRNVDEPIKKSGDLKPDYSLVFSGEPKEVATNVSKALAILSKEGFYVAVRSGAANSVLILVRLSNKAYENANHTGHETGTEAKSRSLVAQELLPWVRLEGYTDSFAVAEAPQKLLSASLLVSDESLDVIETVYGGKTAAAFQLSNYLLKGLVQLSLFGAWYYLRGQKQSKLFALATLLWGTIFVAKWRNFVEPPQVDQSSAVSGLVTRKEYLGTTKSVRELRKLLFIPLAVALMFLYALGLAVVLGFEVFCTHLYDGPFKSIVSLFPMGANIVAAVVYSIVYETLISKFTIWEDYPTVQELSQTRAQRSFYLEVLIGYLPIFLTAYVYLPFGHLVIGYLPQIRSSKVGSYVSLASSFKLDTNRLFNQAFYYSAQQQIIAVAKTTFVPFVAMFVKRNVLKQLSTDSDRFAVEQSRVAFDNDAQIGNQILTFGYVLMLAPVWPLSSFALLVTLYLKSKAYLYLLTSTGRKPTPSYTRSLGFWNNDLQLILGLASIVTPTVCVMYSQSTEYYNYRKSILDITWGEVAGVAFFSENLVLILLYILSNYFKVSARSFNENKKSQPPQVGAHTLDAEQEQIWLQNDVTKDLEKVLKPKLQ